MQQAMKGHQPAGNPNAIEPMTALPAGPAAIRVGVAELNNKTKSSISTGELGPGCGNHRGGFSLQGRGETGLVAFFLCRLGAR